MGIEAPLGAKCNLPAVAQQDTFDEILPDCWGSEEAAKALCSGCCVQLLKVENLLLLC